MSNTVYQDVLPGISSHILDKSNRSCAEDTSARRPLAIDLFCGMFGWSEGLISEGWRTVGFDIEDMRRQFGFERLPHTQLVIQDVTTLHGSQFKSAALIVASPPCQEYSYRAMPWKRAKALPPPDNTLFDTCFRIQREACEASGRHIPLIVENVRGAQPWVGRARWNFGSFYLWGDVPALMPVTLKASKVPGFRFDGSGKSFQSASVDATGIKAPGMNWSDPTKRWQDFTRLAGKHRAKGDRDPMWERGFQATAADRLASEGEHSKQPGIGGKRANGKGDAWFQDGAARFGSKSSKRKMASAMIAKIPLPLSRHIAATFRVLAE